MESRPSPSVEADNRRMAWISQQWRMLQEEREITKVTGEVVEFFLSTLIVGEIKRPDLFTTWSGSIKRAIEEEVGKPLTSHATVNARKVAEGHLYEPDQAVAIEPAKLQVLVDFLWFRKWTNLSFKQSALIAYICAHTGARCNEVVNLYVEDMEWREDEDHKFLRLPLRTSKSNAFKTRREALVVPVPSPENSPFQHWLKVILKERKSGKLFLNTSSAKVRSHYKIAAKALEWAEAPTCHSLRSHYVVQALRAGASESDIVAVCRWKDEAMLNTYRMRQLECTVAGPAFKIFEKKGKAGSNIDLALSPRVEEKHSSKVKAEIIAVSDDDNAGESSRKQDSALVQATIKLARRTMSAGTQTDPIQTQESHQEARPRETRPTLSPQSYASWAKFLEKRVR